MSRIHEALQKAEKERMFKGTDQSAADLPAPILAVGESVAMPTITSEPQPSHIPISLESRISALLPTAWNPDRKFMLFIDAANHSEPGMEEFRTLRSRLSQLRQKRPLKTVLIASALAGEGKSFVSANLAQAIVRQHGRRALLIDGDLRRARLHEYLGAPVTPGLTEFLRGAADEWTILQRGTLDGLFLIPRGAEVSNPAELIANGRFKLLVETLAPAFDWIVVDSAPAAVVSDASLLAEVCDGVLLVVQSGSTPVEAAQKAAQEFRTRPLLGVVLNRTESGSGYGNYYYHGYGSDKPHSRNARQR